MSRRQDWLVCLSFANLCFLDVWDKLEGSWANVALREPPSPSLAQFLGPVLIAVVALAGILWTGLTLLRKLRNPALLTVARWTAVALLLIPLNLFRVEILHFSRQELVAFTGVTGAAVLAAVISVGAVFVAIRWTPALRQVPKIVALLLAPLLPIHVAQKVWAYYHLPSAAAYADKPVAPLLPVKPDAPRVLWLVFDEMDQHLAFMARPASLALPELDRLRAESVYADRAQAAGMYTYEAMAALLSGRIVVQARALGPNEVGLTYDGARDAVRLSGQPTVFGKARDAGFNTAVIGSALPYCRLISESLASCHWEASAQAEIFVKHRSVGERAWSHLKTRPFAFPFLTSRPGFRNPQFGAGARREGRRAQIAGIEEIRKRALALGADPAYQLMLVHWPIPHLLGIYDRRAGQYSLSDASSYVDNLALVDRIVGELRRAMEAAGRWDNTIVLLSADHPLRPSVNWAAGWWGAEDAAATANEQHPYVPFLLKLPYQRRGLTFAAPFNAVLTHDLLLELLAGTLASPESVVAWLESRKSKAGVTPP